MAQITSKTLEYHELKSILPQAYPFVMIDRVIDYTPHKELTAIKSITANEWSMECCQDGDRAIFPETLLIEAAAQAALVLYHVSKAKEGESLQYIFGKFKSEFTHPVLVGDCLKIKALASKMMDNSGFMDVLLNVDAQEIAGITVFYSIARPRG